MADTDKTRVCPACGEERLESDFKSRHPATHCNYCHAKKARKAMPENDSDKTSDGESPVDETVLDSESKIDETVLDDVDVEVDVDDEEVEPKPEPPKLVRPTHCPVLGIEFGRSPHNRMTLWDGVWMSARAEMMLRCNPTPDEVERAWEWLSDHVDAQAEEV